MSSKFPKFHKNSLDFAQSSMSGNVEYSRHFFACSTTVTLFQVQTSSKFVTHSEATLYT